MKHGSCLISVIVPTYCEEENIERCLRSIRKQKFNENIEVIVVDSNSPDNTKAIAENYADKVINIDMRGVSKARNVGAEEAKGKLLLFLDADTILDDHFIARMYKCFNDRRIVGVSGYLVGLEKSGVVDNIFKLFHYNLLNRIASLTAKLGLPLFPTVCCAYRKFAFKKVGGFDENLAIAEDIAFSLKMGKIGRCLVIKEAKAYTSLRRVKKNGRMKNYFSYFRNYYRVFIRNEKPWIRDFPHTCEI
jgi:glycosyltransferase involved in cell wall biosynthesis